jgi:hypothetical protein
MQMIKVNRAIRDHAADGRTIHLFKKVRDGYAQYAGQYEYDGHEIRPNTPDVDGNLRDGIAFKLRPLATGPVTATEVADAVDAVKGIATGQGFSQRMKAADRKALELRAMDLPRWRSFEESRWRAQGPIRQRLREDRSRSTSRGARLTLTSSRWAIRTRCRTARDGHLSPGRS